MSTVTSEPDLDCPPWCRGHRLHRCHLTGVQVWHEGHAWPWSTTDQAAVAKLRRFDGYADVSPALISILSESGEHHDITADEARHLASVLWTLADELDGPARRAVAAAAGAGSRVPSRVVAVSS